MRDQRRPVFLPRLAALALAGPFVLGTPSVEAKVYLTREAALELAFGRGADVERKSAFLTGVQLARARELAGPGVPIPSALVTRYEGRRNGAVVGVAYFDTHVVRTLPESLMVVVAPDGTISRIDVLVFAEPEDYLPKARWFEQYRGRALDRDLSLQRSVHGVTGATLSAQAATDASRRVLAIHRVLAEGAGAAP